VLRQRAIVAARFGGGDVSRPGARAVERTLVLIALLIACFAGSAVVAQETVSVSGQLFDPDGHPSPAMSVELCTELASGCFKAETDFDGRFVFTASPGSYLIAVEDPLSGRRLFYLVGGDGNL